MCGLAMGQEAPSADAPPARVEQQAPAPIERQAAPEPEQEALPPPTVWSYDRAIFQKPFAPDQLSFLKQMDGMPTRQVLKDKQFHKLLGAILPTGMFHYGADRSIESALDA